MEYHFNAPSVDLPGVQSFEGIEGSEQNYWAQREIYLTKVREIAARRAFLDVVVKAQLPQPNEEDGDNGEKVMKCPMHNTPVGPHVANMCECYSYPLYVHQFDISDGMINALHFGLIAFIRAWTASGKPRYNMPGLPRMPTAGHKAPWNYFEYFNQALPGDHVPEAEADEPMVAAAAAPAPVQPLPAAAGAGLLPAGSGGAAEAPVPGAFAGAGGGAAH
jgi:hypothetical protein